MKVQIFNCVTLRAERHREMTPYLTLEGVEVDGGKFEITIWANTSKDAPVINDLKIEEGAE